MIRSTNVLQANGGQNGSPQRQSHTHQWRSTRTRGACRSRHARRWVVSEVHRLFRHRREVIEDTLDMREAIDEVRGKGHGSFLSGWRLSNQFLENAAIFSDRARFCRSESQNTAFPGVGAHAGGQWNSTVAAEHSPVLAFNVRFLPSRCPDKALVSHVGKIKALPGLVGGRSGN